MKENRKPNDFKRLWKLVAILGILPFVVALRAQAQEPNKDNSQSVSGEAKAEALPTDPQARTAWGESNKKEMENLRRRIQRMLDSARAEHDIIKVTCLNDKLSQANANLASFSDRLNAFKKSVSIGDKIQQEHEFTLLSVMAQKQNTIAAEANSCVGEEAGYLGKTEVTVEVDDKITSSDPTNEPVPGVDQTVDIRPAEASGKE